MAYTVYLDGVALPVTPASLKVKIKGKNETVNLIDQGEVNLLKTPGLTEVEFEALLPNLTYTFGGGQGAEYYLSKLESLLTSRRHFQFIVSRVTPGGRLLYSTNLTVALEDYEIQEDAEELGFDSRVTVSLKQWKQYGVKTVEVEEETKEASVTQTRDASTAPQVKTYTVKPGDCLWNIAKQYTGNGQDWNAIYNANRDKIQNPNLIYPGQVLTIP